MRRTLQKIGGSSLFPSLCRQYSPSANALPKPNPNFSLPHSSSSAAQFNRVCSTKVVVHNNFFYCDTEDFKEMLLDYKNDKKKMYPLVMAARMARVREHEKDDDKLMEELGVVKKVDLVGEYQDIHDLDPEERNKLFHDYVDRNKGDWKEVVSPTGNSTWEPVGQYPPNPYGISVVRFSILGPAALNTKHNYIYNMGYDSDNYDSEDY